jgi:FkbM family methyltransferase
MMNYWLKRVLTRPRAVGRAMQKLGFMATLKLIRLRFGSPSQMYQLKVPQWTAPVYVRGGKSSDTTVLYEILVTDEYGMLAGIDEPRTIIDGGANIGLAAVYFLQRYPSASVISVEPFREAFEVCRKNLASYGARATAVQSAIWAHEGRVGLDPQGEDWINRVCAPAEGQSGTAEAVTMASLVKAAGGSVDLLKLDVEGSEKEIFGPGAREWLPFVRNIVIELHGQDCMDRVFEALAPYDYESSNRDMVYLFRNLRYRSAAGRANPN